MDVTGHKYWDFIGGKFTKSQPKDASKHKLGSQYLLKGLLVKDKICTVADVGVDLKLHLFLTSALDGRDYLCARNWYLLR
jgi:hypothetical protein